MIDKKMCCGCAACFNVCPEGCIDMLADREGFLCSVIDKSRCIDCGLCKKVCPALKKGEKQTDIKGYACINNDNSVKMESSSGGAFSVFANYVIEKGGAVFGAMFDGNFNVIHSYIEDVADMHKLRGSKYVQSYIGDSYKNVKEFLNAGRFVLFSGTSCQVAGLKGYLMKDYPNLICIDVICHGVPSPLVFKKYIEQRKKQNNEEIKKISFRDKTEGWDKFSLKIDFAEKQYRKTVLEDKYLRGFISNLYLRPSCHQCNYKGFTCGSDISLADFWGVRKILPEIYNQNGVSLVLVNSERGRKIFNEVSHKMNVMETTLEDCIKCNPAIEKSAVVNKRRSKFFNKIANDDISELIEKTLKPNFINKVNMRIRKIIKNIK